MLRDLHHTQLDTYTHTHIQLVQHVAEAPTYTIHNEHKRRTFINLVGLQPTVSAMRGSRTSPYTTLPLGSAISPLADLHSSDTRYTCLSARVI